MEKLSFSVRLFGSLEYEQLKVQGVICYFSKCNKAKVVIKISFQQKYVSF